MIPADAKSELRQEMLALLRTLPDAERASASAAVVRALLNHPRVLNAECGLLFANLPSEPDLSALVAAHPIRWCLPRVRDAEAMTIHQVSSFDDLTLSPRNIREPDPERHPEINPSELDLILVPGLAFSRTTAHRLGRGGGFYDRFLANTTAYRFGVCFDSQVLEDVPHEDHDAAVDEIVAAT